MDNRNTEQTSLLHQPQADEQVIDIVEPPIDTEALIKPKRNWKYWFIWFWRLCIFAMTGSYSIKVTKLLLTKVFYGQPWYYYVVFFFAELIVYTIMIVSIGSLLFQWRFFCLVAYKMWSWTLPPKIKIWCWNHLHSHTISL